MDWLWQQLASALLGAIVSWIFTRIVDGPRNFAQGEFSADRFPSNRPVYVEVSVKQESSSQSGNLIGVLLGLSTPFYLFDSAHRN
jgi:hypothetical protein